MVGIGKHYTVGGQTVKALDGVDFAVAQGEMVAILGPSGSGKSTLMNILYGILTPTAGQVLVAGERVEGPNPHIGYMLQQDNLLEWRTVRQNVLFGLEIRRNLTPATRARADRLLETYGLSEFADRHPSQLSGGMRQRVMIAIALACSPRLIIADEPTGNIDPKMSMEMMNQLIYIQQTLKKTVIVVTHELYLVKYFRQRVIKLDHGKIVSDTPGGVIE